MTTTWRQVADVLAKRMRHHAHCEDHPESRPGDHCPFCADRAAYRAWQRKAGVRDVPVAGENVNLRELARQRRAER